MQDPYCVFERQVEMAAVSGKWSDDLRSHAEICPDCRDIVLISEGLHALADRSTSEVVLPGAGFMWNKARLSNAREAKQRIGLAVMLVRAIGYLVIATGLVVWVFYDWPEVQGEIAARSARFLTDLNFSFVFFTQPLIYLTVALFGLNLVLTLRVFGRNANSRTKIPK